MSGAPVQESLTTLAVEPWLELNTSLSASSRSSLATAVLSLVSRIDKERKACIGISGAPGSGKSTLSRALVHCLTGQGIPACLLSLDDYYLSRAERERLAREVHPLFRQRGVPGTHDLDRMLADCDRLRNGRIEALRLPAFDKSVDDRAPRSQSRAVLTIPQVIVVEGWCVGAPPQASSEMRRPVNELERVMDSDGRWRRQVLTAWKTMHVRLGKRLDQVWYIRVPDWECVIGWRWQQEQELPLQNLRSRAEVENFLACFERIFHHMQLSFPRWADLALEVDREHDICLPGQNRT